MPTRMGKLILMKMKTRSMKKTMITSDNIIRRPFAKYVMSGMSLMLIGGRLKPKYYSDSAGGRQK